MKNEKAHSKTTNGRFLPLKRFTLKTPKMEIKLFSPSIRVIESA